MYLFFNKVSDTVGRVLAVYQDSELTAEQKNNGYFVHGIPVPEENGLEPILFIDLKDNRLYYEYEEAQSSVDTVNQLKQQLAETKSKLAVAEGKLKTPKDLLDELDVNAVSLDELKAVKIEALKQLCDEATEAGFVSPSLGYKFGFTDKAQSDISKQALIFLANPAKEDCMWNTEDAGIVTLTREQFMNLLPEGEAHTRANVGKLWGLVGQIGAATSKNEVLAVNW